MGADYGITVRDVLDRPLFRQAELVAGGRGLHRAVRWVHILEVPDFDSLLSGEEMILTTGIGIHGLSTKAYIEQLIRQQVSCLCIELGPAAHWPSVTDEMIETADRHDFPLIVFRKTVRFIDITQDLHSLIVNRHHSMLERLEQISREFHRLTLSSSGTSRILKLLHQSTGLPVVYLPGQGSAQCFPALPDGELSIALQSVRERNAASGEPRQEETSFRWTKGKSTYLVRSVGALGQSWADLVLAVKHRPPQEFETLVMDRAAIAVAQDLLRKRYMDERRLHIENLWVDDLIHQRIKSEEQIRSLVGSRFGDLSDIPLRVCLIDLEDAADSPSVSSALPEEELEEIRLHTALLVRSVFEKFSFQPLMTAKGSRLVVVALDLSPSHPHRPRMESLFRTLRGKASDSKANRMTLQFGVGRCYRRFTEVPASYREAREALRIRRLVPRPAGNFYEDIGVFRLLLNLENDAEVRTFVDDYLGPVLAYDRAKGGELVRTLRVYYDNQGSKKLAAGQLFLTRQTLYHRLNKIKELLGADIDAPERRLAIEIAVHACELLSPPH